MIIPQKQWREENRASHGLYLDTPPLIGCYQGTSVPYCEPELTQGLQILRSSVGTLVYNKEPHH